MAQAIATAKAKADAQAAACAQACAQAEASAKAMASAVATARATAQASASATASAYARAQSAASAMSAAVATAVAEAKAQAQAAAAAAATAQAESAACAAAVATATASAQASASAAGSATSSAYAQAYAQAEGFAAAAVFSRAQACAQAAVQAQAAAEAAARAYATAQAAAVSGVQAVAQAAAEAQASAMACVAAEAQAEAQVAVGVVAMAQAIAQAQAAAYAAAEAAVSAYVQAVASVEVYASAQAEAMAHARAAALAQAQAEAYVATYVHAAATALAKAAAAAYASAAAFAGAQASASASVQALAMAEAEAYAAAQACAVALARAEASATAAAEVRVRAAAYATACAEADAQARAMAQACAQAAATASTSVEVVPNIEASVQTFIDPECLQPTCDQYVPSTPGCPPTRELAWDFGQVSAGSTVNSTKSFPTDVTSAVTSLGVVSATRVSSTLPTGLAFDLILASRQGRLSGTVPRDGGRWTAVYHLLDRNQCVVVRLTISIYTTTATTSCPQFTGLKWDFGEVSTGLHLLTTKAIPSADLTRFRSAGIVRVTTISSNLPSGAALNLDINQGLGILTGMLPTAGTSYEVLLGLFDGRNCEMFRYAVSLRTAAAARVADLAVQIVRVAVEKVCDKEYSHLVTVYWQATGGTSPIHISPVSLVYPNGTTQALVGSFPATGSAGIRANLSSGGTVRVRVQANDAAGRTKTAEQSVELETCVQIGIIGPIVIGRLLTQTLEVYARRQVMQTPGYEELKVPVRITGETADRVTPFSGSFASGSQVTIRFPGRIAGGSYGRGPLYYEEWVGDATTPTRKNGTWDARREYYSITVTMSAKVKIIVWYQDIIG